LLSQEYSSIHGIFDYIARQLVRFLGELMPIVSRLIFEAVHWAARTKDEIDMVGYDGGTLAFVEVRTRTAREEMSTLPELSVTPGKQHVLARTAQHFLSERPVPECPCRFDVVAIDNSPGKPPVVRLHKDAFSPQM
jgi:putative endonuclease